MARSDIFSYISVSIYRFIYKASNPEKLPKLWNSVLNNGNIIEKEK